MSGIKGMTHSRHRAGTLRARAWNSMRILRRFTLPDLCRTSAVDTTDGDYENLKKWVNRLNLHGVIAKDGPPRMQTPGGFQLYRLVRDSGPFHPLNCSRCGLGISATHCEIRETEKERNNERKQTMETEPPPGGES